MIKERLKEIDLKITDLSEFLKISRQTLYKYIEDFDNGNHKAVNRNVLKLFKFINDNELVGKRATINYILTNLVDEKELGEKADTTGFMLIKKKMISEPDSAKSRFMKLLAEKSDFDDVCDYMLKIYPLLRKRNLTEDEIALIKPYDDIRNIIESKKEG